MTASIQIIVNGEAREVPVGTTVAGLIAELGLAKGACAAEVNKSLVPRKQHGERKLADQDQVELVTLVGGG